RYRRWNNGGTSYAHRRIRRAGKDANEPEAIRNLRRMFSIGTTHGHLVSTFDC
ncbi:unnamed protein product, partial [Laminaria digitata]